MTFNRIIIYLFILAETSGFGQEVNGVYFEQGDTSRINMDTIVFSWSKVYSYDINPEEVWVVDGIGNVYISQNGVINKYDTTGVLKFTQSIKSLGKMQQLLPVNSMKLVHFSEEQQTLCYLDNTLTPFNDCIELSDQGFVNASLVSSSGRSDMIWVYDNVNSKLVLLPMQENQQNRQEIDNLTGILGVANVSQIIERGNQLYMVDEGNVIYIFDLYGSLIEFKEEKGVKSIDVNDKVLFILIEKELKMHLSKFDTYYTVPLPVEGIVDFRFRNQQFFLRTYFI